MAGKEYRTITDVKGPLVFLNKTEPVAYGEIVSLRLSNGDIKNGQVLDTSDDMVVVQVFEGTAKVDRQAGVTFLGDVFKLPVSTDLVGRILDGAGRPRDGGPEIVADEKADIIGAAINQQRLSGVCGKCGHIGCANVELRIEPRDKITRLWRDKGTCFYFGWGKITPRGKATIQNRYIVVAKHFKCPIGSCRAAKIS